MSNLVCEYRHPQLKNVGIYGSDFYFIVYLHIGHFSSEKLPQQLFENAMSALNLVKMKSCSASLTVKLLPYKQKYKLIF